MCYLRTAYKRGRLEEEEGNHEEGERDGDTPRGAPLEVVRMGGDVPPPRRETRTPRNLTLIVCICCCRDSMETSCITTMGCTWIG